MSFEDNERTALLKRNSRRKLRAWLIVEPGTTDERRVEIGRELSIGSQSEADIVLEDPHVSRLHARIKRTMKGIQIEDLGSSNGTFVEGVAVQGALLQSGATITLGRSTLRIETDQKPAELSAEAMDDLIAEAPESFGGAVGRSEGMRRVFSMLERVAPSLLPVLLLGETGTGKGVLAQAIHRASQRGEGPFVVFDCGAVAPTLIESQLFGHEKGAFTGAVAQHLGAFERAHSGTLFLDEIGELSLDLQPKLLRVIEDGHVMRVGGTHVHAVDVRIVAATNRDLEEDVRQGRFREDLYFRISGVMVSLPPLRKRLEDLPLIIEAFADRIREGLTVTPEVLRVLQSYDWPGNVRELRNVIAGACAMTDARTLHPQDFVFMRRHRRHSSLAGAPLAGRTLDSIERAAIQQTLDECGGNRAKAAEALGIAASTLYQKIKKYDL